MTQMVKASGEDFLNIEVRKDGFYLSQLIKKQQRIMKTN